MLAKTIIEEYCGGKLTVQNVKEGAEFRICFQEVQNSIKHI